MPYAGRMLFLEKQRDRIEKEQDLKAQEFAIQSLSATIEQSRKRIAQLQSNYHQALQNERVETEAQYAKLEQDWNKHSARHDLLELRRRKTASSRTWPPTPSAACFSRAPC